MVTRLWMLGVWPGQLRVRMGGGHPSLGLQASLS